MKFLFCLIFVFTGCAIQSHNNTKSAGQLKTNGPIYKSPGEKIIVEFLIHESTQEKPLSYLGRISLKNDTKVPEHNHLDSDEYLYFTKGGGVLIIEDVTYKIEDGSAVYIPRGAKHSYSNDSGHTVHAIQIYTPAGPEERFKYWESRK